MTGRVILADDHAMVRQGVRDLVRSNTDWEVVGEARDTEEAERLARSVAADLMILDVAMPSRGGVAVLEALRASSIMLPILVFSMVPPRQYIPHLKSGGAQGFVGKDEDEQTLLVAMRSVMGGGTYFPRGPTQRQEFLYTPPGILSKLSSREAVLVQAILAGKPLVLLAQELGISAQSVGTYRRRVLDKLGVANNAELIGLLKPAD
jgi:DNA-binding NarL/FixJ family response regulator